ncbi:MAG: 2-octaprenyl-6-methoxyphenyl hydroxylase [Rhodobacteraceae bacterium]|nr:MAG: 2-octaprenyl-6-methoxyphenyl hydroxylase [Paracoccaceae bacterium]
MDNPGVTAIFAFMTHDSDLLIVGGGLNGPTLALAAAQAGFSATVIDAADSAVQRADNFDGRAYALALASQRMLSALGLWDRLAPQAQPMLDIKVTDGRVGEGPAPFGLHFDHHEIEEGPMGFMVEDRFLRRTLLDAMAAHPAITHLSRETVVAQDSTPAQVIVTLASGRVLTGPLLAGCDGRTSGTAQRAGIGRSGRDYGQSALVCAITHEKPHNGVAHQFFMPAGPLAILPLTGNRSLIVWSETHELAAKITALPEEDYLTVLRPRFGDFLGEIALEGQRFTYPLSLTLAQSLTGPRLVLVGDAAHGLHPIAGQGLNAGFRDIAALAEVLTDASRRGEDIGAPQVLERYARWRRFDTATLAGATDMFNVLFSNDNPLLRLGRDLGMGLVNAIPALRRGFIREAAGLTGDLPRLMKGDPL